MTTTKNFGSGNDSFTGVWWDQYIITDAGGNDRFVLGDQHDFVWAGTGDDYVFGWGGNDTIDGQGGNDTLYGANGDDSLVGGAGNDRLYGGEGHDDLFGGDNDDRLEGYNGHDELDGGAGADLLYGGEGYDILRGGGGNDHLFGGSGVNSIDGGSGVDTVRMDENFDSLMPRFEGVNLDRPFAHVDLQTGVARIVGSHPTDVYVTNTVVNVENIVGTNSSHVNGFADILRGNTSNNRIDANDGDDLLEGRGGSDTLFGGFGRDLLDGGSGNDSMWGGGGNDTFVFQPGSGEDRIYDFTDGDRLDVRSYGFTSTSNMDISRFIEADTGATGTHIMFGSLFTAQAEVWLYNVAPSTITASDFIFA